jgi:hypothetical protein
MGQFDLGKIQLQHHKPGAAARHAPGAPASGTAGVEFFQKRAEPEIGAPL